MSPEDVVRAYFQRMLDRDPSIVELFADDAVLLGLGDRVEGRPAIDEFYAYAQTDAAAKPTVVTLCSVGGRVLAEIDIEVAGGGRVHVVDAFDVEDGKITSVTYFLADYPTAPG